MSSSRYQNRPPALTTCSSKRRRRTAGHAAATITRDSSSWASLPEDLVDLIGSRVLAGGDLLDYIRFRAVCPHWRSTTACPRGRGIVDRRFHPRRWMLFPEGHGLYPGHGKLRGFVRFFNLSTGAFVRVRLPLFRDHCVLDAVDGLLLLQRDHDTAVRILQPFTGDILDFPPLNTLLRYIHPRVLSDKWYYLRNFKATTISVSANEVVSLMIWSNGMLQVAFATSGEQQWRASSWRFYQVSSPLPFQGKLYVVHQPVTYGEPDILLIDPPQQLEEGTTDASPPPPRLIAKCPASKPDVVLVYSLVECNSEILLITLKCGDQQQPSVYRLVDLILGRTVRLTSIGGNALFVGERNLCVRAKAFPTIVADSVVCINIQRRYIAQYHLSSSTILPKSDGPISIEAIPGPRSIIYHIYTCCYRRYWNKGQIKFRDKMKNWRVKRKWRFGA